MGLFDKTPTLDHAEASILFDMVSAELKQLESDFPTLTGARAVMNSNYRDRLNVLLQKLMKIRYPGGA